MTEEDSEEGGVDAEEDEADELVDGWFAAMEVVKMSIIFVSVLLTKRRPVGDSEEMLPLILLLLLVLLYL